MQDSLQIEELKVNDNVQRNVSEDSRKCGSVAVGDKLQQAPSGVNIHVDLKDRGVTFHKNSKKQNKNKNKSKKQNKNSFRFPRLLRESHVYYITMPDQMPISAIAHVLTCDYCYKAFPSKNFLKSLSKIRVTMTVREIIPEEIKEAEIPNSPPKLVRHNAVIWDLDQFIQTEGEEARNFLDMFDFESFLNYYKEFSKNNKAYAVYYKVVGGFIIYLYHLWRSRNLSDFVAATTAWLLPYADTLPDIIVDFMILARSWFVDYYMGIRLESDIEDSSLTFFRKVLSSNVVTAFRDAMINVAGLTICPQIVKSGVTKFLGEPKPMDLLSFLKSMGDVFENFSFMINAWFEGVPFSKLLTSPEPYSDLISKIMRHLMYEDKLYTGLKTKGMMDARQYTNLAHEYLRTAKLFIPRIKKGSVQHNTLKTLVIKLENSINVAQRLIGSKSRVAPLGIVIHGVPGIGKSKIVGHILRVHCAVKGRPWSDDYSYTRVKTSDYWEGYIPEAHPYILYSELGSKSLQQVKTKGDDIVEEMTSLIDDLPFPCDMAFGQKGTVFANPELVVVDTNNENMNLEILTANPAAHYRRNIYIRGSVKTQYVRSGTNMLDTEKSFNDTTTDIMDRWNFDVYRREAIDNKNYKTIDILRCGNIFELTQVMAKLYTEHIHKTYNIKSNLQTDYDMKRYLGADFAPDERVIRERIAILKDDDHLNDREKSELSTLEKMAADISDKYREEFFTSLNEEDADSVDSDTSYFERMARVPQAGELYTPENSIETESANVTEIIANMSAWTFDPLSKISYGYWAIKSYREIFRLSKPEYYYILSLFLSVVALLVMNFFNKMGQNKLSLLILSALGVGIYYIFGVICLMLYIQFTVGFIYIKDTSSLALSIVKSYLDASYDDALELTQMHWGISNVVAVKPVRESKYGQYAVRAAMACGAVCTAAGLYWALRVRTTQQETVHKEIYDTEGSSKLSINLQKIETLVEAKPPSNRIAVKNTTIWNTVDYPQVSQQSENTLENILNKVKRNVRDTNVVVFGQTHHTKILGLYGNVVAINSHVLYATNPATGKREAPSSFTIYIAPPHMEMKDAKSTKVTIVDRYKEICEDITLFEVESLQFSDIRPLLFNGDIATNIGYDINGEQTAITPNVNFTADMTTYPITYTGAIHYRFKGHKKGDCGTPLLVNHGKGYAIAGLHCAGSAMGEHSYAVRLPLSKVEWTFTMIPIFSEKGNLPHTIPPDEKSPFRYEVLHNLHLFGQLPGAVTLPKQSEVRLNPIYSAYTDILQTSIFDDQGREKFGAPVMKPKNTPLGYVSPYNLALNNMNCDRTPLDPARVQRVIDSMFGRMKDATTALSPLTFEAALNGASNDVYLRAMNMSTSAGYGFPGKKRDYILLDEDGKRVPVKILQDKVEDVIKGYLDEKAGDCIYNAALKDETRSRKKIDSGDTRVFYVGPFAHLLVDRMFLAPLFTLLQEKSELFCTAIGYNMHEAADKMVRGLLARGTKFVELDYKKFDLKLPFGVKRAVHTLIVRLLRHWGYNKDAIKIVTGILNDNMFVCVKMLNFVFSVPGLTPSGMFATAEKNSFYGLFNLKYVFDILYPNDNFWEAVTVYIYGDDVLACVDEKYTLFNNVVIGQILKESMGLDCTPADKNGVFKPYLTLPEVSFLKRHFVYRTDLGRWVAPLEVDSLLKMGSYYIPSRVVDKYTQDCDTAVSFLYEWFLHVESDLWVTAREKLIGKLSLEHSVPRELVAKRMPSVDKLQSTMFTS